MRNPYLAAQQFLEASNINVIEAESLLQLKTLEGVGAALITDANQVANPRQLESVLGWLKQGGHLIVAANTLDNSGSLLLSQFHIDIKPTETQNEKSVDNAPSTSSEALRDYNDKIKQGMTPKEITNEAVNKSSLTIVDFGGTIGNVTVNFDSQRILDHPYLANTDDETEPRPFSWLSSDHGVHALQFDVGDGLLTVVSDSSIWQSWKIDQYDHAFFLWILSSGNGDFVLIRPAYGQSLWTLVMKYGYEGLFALALLIVSLLWRRGQRLGRTLPFPSNARRAMGEYFSTTANYLWRNQAIEPLLQPSRQSILQLACQAIPGFEQADTETRMEMIAGYCQLDKFAVSQALQAKQFSEPAFVRTVKLLKDIEQSL